MRSTTTARLSSECLSWFEDWFQEDLSSIRIVLYPSRSQSCTAYRPKAFTDGSNIYIADSILDAAASEIENLLAHEFAHAVQKRRALTLRRSRHYRQPSAFILEREAHYAGAAFSLGERCPTLSADHRPEIRAWGPAGHYYSVYFISRFAGLPDPTAEQLAFFAQMPDQVTNLDAIIAGTAFAVWALTPPAHRTAMGPAGERAIDIARGAHCLTGNPGGIETKRRLEVLKGTPHIDQLRGIFAFGLGLHPLGDSYAHRTGDSDSAPMYSAPMGHAFAERIWKLGKDVDSLCIHSGLYKRYCADMLAVIGAKFNVLAKPLLDSRQTELNKLLDVVCSAPSEDKQITLLQNFYPDKKGSYRPEKDPMPWEKFALLHARQVTPRMGQEAQVLIDSWGD
jgi:hypothetical protein